MRLRRSMVSAAAALIITAASAVAAQESRQFYPGAVYSSSIPTLRQVVGHDWGDKITMHHEAVAYLNALHGAAGSRTRLIRYAESWEGRALYLLVIGSEENIARLDAVKAGMRKLSDPRRTGRAEADSLIASLPAIVWLIHGVHGNEISSTDASLMTAYHLLAAQNDEIMSGAMKNTLVLIDPMQNPDGRDRFINYFRQNLGLVPDGDLQSAEHNEVWPSGRVNHYLFDMNRDWFAQTQPETRGRTRLYLEWFPLVVADLHEMGTNSTYYFAPPALPWNPNLTRTQLDWLTRFGRNNAKWFDRFGFDYFTRENYDSFYPGYGEGWPLFHGSIGMTYEQASVRGLVADRDDQSRIRYRDSVHHHFIASISTIESASSSREALLRHFYDYRRTAIEEGEKETVREYIITPGSDPNRAARLAGLLMQSGIEVRRAAAPFANPRTRDYFGGALQQREFPAGSYIVSLAQPAKRLARTLLDKQTSQDREFLEEQRRRNEKRQNEDFYDVTAWSLPLIFDVQCYMAEQASTVQSAVLTEPPAPAGKLTGGQAGVAYLIKWGTQSAASALADLFRQDIRVYSSDLQFRIGSDVYPAGSLIVKVKDNPNDLHQRMVKLVADHGVDVVATDSAWVDEGPNFGSNNVSFLKRPRIAIAYNTPTSPNSVGWLRYVIEQRYGYPVTTIRSDQLRSADLNKYNVLILPDTFGGYDQQLGDGAALKTWVQRGGTLVGIAGAMNWMIGEKVKLLATTREKRGGSASAAKAKDEDKDGAAAKVASQPDDVQRAIQPDEEFPSNTPGAILRVKVDNSHWLGFGYGDTTTVMVDSNRVYSLLKLDKGTNVARYLDPAGFFVSGFMWDDAKNLIPNKAWLVHSRLGRGNVIGFAEDPNYRAFMDGLNLFVINAVFQGPGR